MLQSHATYAQAGAEAQPANDVAPQAKLYDDIVSTNARVRFDAAMQLEGQKKQLLYNLPVLLKSPIPDDQKMGAVAILGENRFTPAIPYLVNHLEWQINLTNPAALAAWYGNLYAPWTSLTIRSGHQRELSDLICTSPVTGSLARIGLDDIPALLDRISQLDDERIILVCDNRCILFEGDGNVAAEVTQLRLQDRFQKETDPKKKARFQTALDLLRKVRPKYWNRPID